MSTQKKPHQAQILVNFTPKATIGPNEHRIDLQAGQVVEYYRNGGAVHIRWGHTNIRIASEELVNLQFLTGT